MPVALAAAWMLIAVAAAPASAQRLGVGSANAVDAPTGGVPTVIWNGNFFANGSPGALGPTHELFPFDGSASMNTGIARAGSKSVVLAEPYIWSGRALRSAGVYFGGIDSAGRVSTARILDGGFEPHVPILAGSSGGDALVAWNYHDKVAAVDRMAPNGSLRPPVVAGRFAVEDAAIDGQGNATLIGYQPGGGPLLVTTAARGADFGTPVALPASAEQGDVSSGPGGQTAVVSKGANDGLKLLYRPRPDAPFDAPQQIAGTEALSLESSAVDAQGGVLVAWSEFDETQHLRLRVMITDAAGRATTPETVSSPGRDLWYQNASAAMNDAGDVAAVWEEADPPTGTTPDAPTPRTYAALRPAGGSFGPAQELTPAGRAPSFLAPPAVAVGTDGNAVLVWNDGASGTYSDERFMSARLTSSGVTDVTRLDTGPVDKPPTPSTPPLLKASLGLRQGQRLTALGGKLRVPVHCTSWTLDPCSGRVTVVTKGSHRTIASRKVDLRAGSGSTLSLRLGRAARRLLARGATLHATVRVRLAGLGAAGGGASKSVAIRPA